MTVHLATRDNNRHKDTDNTTLQPVTTPYANKDGVRQSRRKRKLGGISSGMTLLLNHPGQQQAERDTLTRPPYT